MPSQSINRKLSGNFFLIELTFCQLVQQCLLSADNPYDLDPDQAQQNVGPDNGS